MRERRKHPRIPLVSIARLTRRGVEAARPVVIRDISTHGVGIYSDEAYLENELVLIHFSLSAAEGTLTDSMAGEVAWISPLPDGIHYTVGIRFDQMAIEKPKLYVHIKQLEEAT